MINKNNYLMVWLITQFMKNDWSTFIQILTIIFHHQKWTQTSWLFTKMNQTTLLTTQNIFVSISADSYVNTRSPTSKKVTPTLVMNNWTKYQTPRVHQHHYILLNKTCKMLCKNYKWNQISCNMFWTCYHNN